MNESYCVIMVESTSQAMSIEKFLGAQGISSKLIPVPRHLSSDCGVCLRFLDAERDKVRELLRENQIKVQAIATLPSPTNAGSALET